MHENVTIEQPGTESNKAVFTATRPCLISAEGGRARHGVFTVRCRCELPPGIIDAWHPRQVAVTACHLPLSP